MRVLFGYSQAAIEQVHYFYLLLVSYRPLAHAIAQVIAPHTEAIYLETFDE